MIFCSPLYLADKNGFLAKKVVALPVYKDTIHLVEIAEVIMIKKFEMCLVVLEKPFWKVGWAGVTYVNNIKEMEEENLKTINHPERRRNA